ncbi:Molybdopterin oxidoreductase [Paraburkholderia tuberum]|uniref:Molybdopterin oxidoreductase n=1 Tax=Paraburkholderia tuberum TaxID=157910 RepID=A0A1H1K035_9BURK|nr:Molybdopterin oxidoreductase [Paraburkholderia tuberum]
MERQKLIACQECDLLFRKPSRLKGQVASCSRCGASLKGMHGTGLPLDWICAVTLARLIGFTRVAANPDSWEGWYWGAMQHFVNSMRVGVPSGNGGVEDCLKEADMIVFWSCDPESTNGAYAGFEGTPRRLWAKDLGIEFVHIDPHCNPTAQLLGGRWIPVRPQTDAALATAIMYVWVMEGLYDEDYIATRTTGFDEWRAYLLGETDGVPKTPEWQEGETGVPAKDVRALARRWGKKKVHLAVGMTGAGFGGAGRGATGAQSARCMSGMAHNLRRSCEANHGGVRMRTTAIRQAWSEPSRCSRLLSQLHRSLITRTRGRRKSTRLQAGSCFAGRPRGSGKFTMAIRLLKVLVILLVSGAGFCPVAAHAYALDGQFDCRASPHAFIGQLINNQYINPNPMHVEANSVNAFRPTQGSDITVFGFRVYAVLGYEQDDGTFKKGRGNAFAGPLYGAVLSAPSDAVESRVRDAGSNATVRMVIPLLLTAVVCSPS